MHPHHVSCSLILTAALLELFPKVRIVDFQGTERCFFCEFTLPFPFEKEMIPLLEDRMKSWIRKKLPFETLEMVPTNAAEYLKSQGDFFTLDHAHKGLAVVTRIGHFAAPSIGNCLEHTGEIKFFKLSQVQKIEGRYRLIGVASHSKDELKKIGKQVATEENLADELAILKTTPKGDIWLPRGERLKKNLIDTALQLLPPVDLITTPGLDERGVDAHHTGYLKTYQSPSGEIFKTPLGLVDRLFFPFNEAATISYLQIIAKFLTIFDFNFEVAVIGKPTRLFQSAIKKSGITFLMEKGDQSVIEFRLADSLGRRWVGPRMWYKEKEGVVVISFFNTLERFVRLLLEHCGGDLPFWLQPDQVRIFAFDSNYGKVIEEKLRAAEIKVALDNQAGVLKSRLAQALRERVPFSIVVGEKEKAKNRLAVRAYGSENVQHESVETLIDRLKQLEN